MNKLIVIGGSAGSFKIVSSILSALPKDYPNPVVICLHRLKNIRSGFVDTLSLNSAFTIREAYDKEPVLPSTAYIAPSNYHLMIEYSYCFGLSVEAPVNHSRPAIDITMETAAEVYQKQVVGIILSGANNDGANGMFKIQKKGGTTIIQSPESCEIHTMPRACLDLFKPDYTLDVDSIIKFILDLGK